MESVDSLFSTGPADSLLVRLLFYLGDGAMAGAVLYFVVAAVFFVLSTFFSGLTVVEFALVGLLIMFGLAIGTRNLWASLSVGHSQRTPPVYQEWKTIRQWSGVAVVAIPIAAILVGITVLRWGWEFGWFLPESNLLMLATLGFGLVLRMVVRYAVSGNTDSKAQT